MTAQYDPLLQGPTALGDHMGVISETVTRRVRRGWMVPTTYRVISYDVDFTLNFAAMNGTLPNVFFPWTSGTLGPML